MAAPMRIDKQTNSWLRLSFFHLPLGVVLLSKLPLRDSFESVEARAFGRWHFYRLVKSKKAKGYACPLNNNVKIISPSRDLGKRFKALLDVLYLKAPQDRT